MAGAAEGAEQAERFRGTVFEAGEASIGGAGCVGVEGFMGIRLDAWEAAGPTVVAGDGLHRSGGGEWGWICEEGGGGRAGCPHKAPAEELLGRGRSVRCETRLGGLRRGGAVEGGHREASGKLGRGFGGKNSGGASHGPEGAGLRSADQAGRGGRWGFSEGLRGRRP